MTMKQVIFGALLLGAVSAAPVWAGAVDERLAVYRAQGAGSFNAANGEALWKKTFNPAASDKARSCATCHGSDLRVAGKHAQTGKPIDPMAPSVNPKRLSDARFIEKWFLRNCKWTLGRECTAQEKGDVLVYLGDL